jgi:hypothetical protein
MIDEFRSAERDEHAARRQPQGQVRAIAAHRA